MSTHEATRFSGEIKLYLRHDDNANQWIVRVVTKDGGRTQCINSTNWVAQGQSVDCSEAWDQAATTALSFCISDDEEDTHKDISTMEYMERMPDGSPYVSRSFKQSFRR